MAYMSMGIVQADRCAQDESFKACATRVARETRLCRPGESFVNCSKRFARELVQQAKTAQKAGAVDKKTKITPDTPAAVLPGAGISPKKSIIAGIPDGVLLGGAALAFLMWKAR